MARPDVTRGVVSVPFVDDAISQNGRHTAQRVVLVSLGVGRTTVRTGADLVDQSAGSVVLKTTFQDNSALRVMKPRQNHPVASVVREAFDEAIGIVQPDQQIP